MKWAYCSIYIPKFLKGLNEVWVLALGGWALCCPCQRPCTDLMAAVPVVPQALLEQLPFVIRLCSSPRSWETDPQWLSLWALCAGHALISCFSYALRIKYKTSPLEIQLVIGSNALVSIFPEISRTQLLKYPGLLGLVVYPASLHQAQLMPGCT
jgi:hypothetical protein